LRIEEPRKPSENWEKTLSLADRLPFTKSQFMYLWQHGG